MRGRLRPLAVHLQAADGRTELLVLLLLVLLPSLLARPLPPATAHRVCLMLEHQRQSPDVSWQTALEAG
jgi:hypothetical protein